MVSIGERLAQLRSDKKALARGWLWLSVYSLVAAGLMSLLLALARTPFIHDLIPGVDLFKIALVVHVDLSAVIWFFACAGLLWMVLSSERCTQWDIAAFALTVMGTLMISAAPLFGAGTPIMNNYIPVLEHPWFFAGLLLVAFGVCVQAVRYLRQRRSSDPLPTAMFWGAIGLLLAMACFAATYWQVGQPGAALAGVTYYEVLFWGGGHVLQFVYTLMVLGAWAALLEAGGTRGMQSLRVRGVLQWLLALTAMPMVVAPFMYVFPVDSREHILGFTYLMRFGGLASVPLGLLLVYAVFARRDPIASALPLRAAVICSMSLFAAGGALGFLIRGSNTVIPAHYHGSIVGVTLALMGLVYYLLNYVERPVTMPRVARWQPYVYATGQLLHISGLAFSGGYGVQRKVAGAEQALRSLAETAGMGLMGLGGLVSVVGGVMFLVVVMTALWAKSRAPRVVTTDARSHATRTA